MKNKCNECGQDIPENDEKFIENLIKTVESWPDFMRQGINHHTYDGYWAE